MLNIRILVVEDEPDVRAVLHSFFGRRGCEVLSADNGREALRLISEAAPELVFLDLNLGGTCGLDVLRELRRKDVRVTVIVVTGQFLEEESIREVMSLGVAAILQKPVSLLAMEELVVKAVGGGMPVFSASGRQAAGTANPVGIDRHKLANWLGLIRTSCEAFVLDEEEGYHDAAAAAEIRTESARVMRRVIESVDRIHHELFSNSRRSTE